MRKQDNRDEQCSFSNIVIAAGLLLTGALIGIKSQEDTSYTVISPDGSATFVSNAFGSLSYNDLVFQMLLSVNGYKEDGTAFLIDKSTGHTFSCSTFANKYEDGVTIVRAPECRKAVDALVKVEFTIFEGRLMSIKSIQDNPELKVRAISNHHIVLK